MTYKAEIRQDFSISPLIATEDFTTLAVAELWILEKLEAYRGNGESFSVTFPVIPFVRRAVSIVDTNGEIAANQHGIVTEYGKA
jgi:hypothetical protein